MNYTQACRRGLSLAAGTITKGDEGCSGGWVFNTDKSQPCPRCGHGLTVLSRVPR